MTFEEILDQAIAMLQRRGRVTYRLLQRQFQLDDDTLGDLLAELRYAHGEVISEDEQGMVWTGGAAVLPTPPPSVPQPFQPSVSQEAPAPQADGMPTALSTPDAERRQLTVMFCDLVESTKLASQLDPEDLREVVRAYQQVCSEVITRFDGHIAQLLGDGLLVYFGYPQAHEDDAQRAVRTGLGILEAMGDLNTRLQQDKGIHLVLRMGIHTGLVVVGEMGSGGRQEQLALGETPNLAARLQGLAAPNTLVVSSATYRLIQGYFECQDLGAQTLRGVAEPITVYQILRESGATSRLDIAQPRGLTPLIGREFEVTLLLERWEQAKAGHGQVMLLSGEAGIGKSRLVQMLKEQVANQPHVHWECRSLSYFENTVLFPLTDLFHRLWQFQTEDTPDAKLEKIEQALRQYRLPLEETVPLFAPLLTLPLPENRYPPLNLSPQRQRQKTLETITAILLELAEHQPVLFILEDLHWTDPTTLELLGLLVEQVPTAAIYTLLTCRPHFQPAWHHRSYLTEITVNRLPRRQAVEVIHHVAHGKVLPPEVVEQIVAKTDGVPLFVEELTKMVLESGLLQERDERYELTGPLHPLAIPATLYDSLMARLDRLAAVKALAQLGAALGREFSYALLRAVAPWNEGFLHEGLHQLVAAEFLYQRGVPPQATYTFKHALIQDVAYQSLLRSTRQQYHQRIAQVLEARFAELVETQPELLAHHYTEAGLVEQAMPYWHKAGQRASARSAHVEAAAHLRRGLEVLASLPDTSERLQHELALQTTLGPVLMATKGYASPEAEHVYRRARQLCDQLGETPQLFQVLLGLRFFYQIRGALQSARELGEQLLHLAQHMHSHPYLVQAHTMLGHTLCFRGEFVAAHEHVEQAMSLYDAHQHPAHVLLSGLDPGVLCLCAGAWTLWPLGYPDQALARAHAALALASALAHPQSVDQALFAVARVHQYRREVDATREQVERAIAVSSERGFQMRNAMGTLLQGWVLAMQGKGTEGMAQMCQGLAAYRATGAEVSSPYYLALLAEVHAQGGQTEAGLSVVAEALALVNSNGERWWEAELLRLKGALLLQQTTPDERQAEACFQQALDIAKRQYATSWELRAATSLSRLWQQQGKRAKAHELLAPIYGWFTEGFDTVDLQEAKTLLAAPG